MFDCNLLIAKVFVGFRFDLEVPVLLNHIIVKIHGQAQMAWTDLIKLLHKQLKSAFGPHIYEYF